MAFPKEIRRISDMFWEIPPSFKEGMRVPDRIYAAEKILKEMDAAVFDQVTNVATFSKPPLRGKHWTWNVTFPG